jgi:competence protein ComGC
MNKKQNGFGAVEILVVILVLSAIGLAVWYVLNKNNAEQTSTTNPTSQTTQATNQNNEQTSNETISANWLLRQSNEASIKVPDGFKILVTDGQPIDFVLPETPVYEKGVTAAVVGQPAKHFELGIIAGYNTEGWNDRGAEIKKFQTDSGLPVTVKLFEQQNDPEGLDFAKGTKHLKYTVTKGNKYFNIDYAYQGEGIVDIVEQMVKTVTIQ